MREEVWWVIQWTERQEMWLWFWIWHRLSLGLWDCLDCGISQSTALGGLELLCSWPLRWHWGKQQVLNTCSSAVWLVELLVMNTCPSFRWEALNLPRLITFCPTYRVQVSVFCVILFLHSNWEGGLGLSCAEMDTLALPWHMPEATQWVIMPVCLFPPSLQNGSIDTAWQGGNLAV